MPLNSVIRFAAFIILLGNASLWGQADSRNTHPPEAVGFAGDGLHLYPLGWSSEGRWGALVGKKNSPADVGKLHFVIVDSVTDEVLFESDTLAWDGPEAMEAIWKAKSTAIKKILTSYDLEYDARLDVRDPAFITGGIRYTFIMNPPSPTDKPYTLNIKNSHGESKLVHNSGASGEVNRAWLLGALLSPYEQRALAVIREQTVKGGFSYRFVGAHLTQGFARAGKITGGKIPTGSLLNAIFNGQEYLVKSRLKAGGDPNIRDARGYPAIIIAARLGHWNILNDLLNAGANPHPRDSSGFTALHYAAYANNANAVKILLNAGANKHVRDGAGRSPAELTNDKTIRYLLQ